MQYLLVISEDENHYEVEGYLESELAEYGAFGQKTCSGHQGRTNPAHPLPRTRPPQSRSLPMTSCHRSASRRSAQRRTKELNAPIFTVDDRKPILLNAPETPQSEQAVRYGRKRF